MKSSPTTHCLISLLHFIYQILQSRKTATALAFIDFRKAPNPVDHTAFITKAIKIGFPPTPGILAGRLFDRASPGSKSSEDHVHHGVIYLHDVHPPAPHIWRTARDAHETHLSSRSLTTGSMWMTLQSASPSTTPQDILARLHG